MIVNTFQSICNMLEKKNQNPQFHVMDNEASNTIKDFLVHKSINYQLVPPKEHRVNATERAIQTFNNHFITCLCSPYATMGSYPTAG